MPAWPPAKETVRRFYRAESVDELLAAARSGRCSVLEPSKVFLHDGWRAGRRNVLDLHRQIIAQGYHGSYSAVRDYLAPLRAVAVPPPAPTTPKVRRVTSWLLRHPENLDPDVHIGMKQVCAACPSRSGCAGRDGQGRARRHAPDFFARLDDGTGVVVDVRPDDRIPVRDAETFTLTASVCRSAGWEYRRSGDLDAVLVANVRW